MNKILHKHKYLLDDNCKHDPIILELIKGFKHLSQKAEILTALKDVINSNTDTCDSVWYKLNEFSEAEQCTALFNKNGQVFLIGREWENLTLCEQCFSFNIKDIK